MFSLGSRKPSRPLSSKCFNKEGSRPTQHEQRAKKKVQTLSSRVLFVMFQEHWQRGRMNT